MAARDRRRTKTGYANLAKDHADAPTPPRALLTPQGQESRTAQEQQTKTSATRAVSAHALGNEATHSAAGPAQNTTRVGGKTTGALPTDGHATCRMDTYLGHRVGPGRVLQGGRHRAGQPLPRGRGCYRDAEDRKGGCSRLALCGTSGQQKDSHAGPPQASQAHGIQQWR